MVFNLPSIDAATTLPFCPDIILQESTTISRDIITTGITIDIAPSYARIINKPFTNQRWHPLLYQNPLLNYIYEQCIRLMNLIKMLLER